MDSIVASVSLATIQYHITNSCCGDPYPSFVFVVSRTPSASDQLSRQIRSREPAARVVTSSRSRNAGPPLPPASLVTFRAARGVVVPHRALLCTKISYHPVTHQHARPNCVERRVPGTQSSAEIKQANAPLRRDDQHRAQCSGKMVHVSRYRLLSFWIRPEQRCASLDWARTFDYRLDPYSSFLDMVEITTKHNITMNSDALRLFIFA